jgi:hypothetical protein
VRGVVVDRNHYIAQAMPATISTGGPGRACRTVYHSSVLQGALEARQVASVDSRVLLFDIV